MIRRGQTGYVPRRLAGPLAWVTLATILSGCQVSRPSAVERPTATEVAAALPKDAKIDQIVYADLTGDGRDEVLVAATLPDQIQTLRRAMAFVFAPGRRGQYTPVLQRDVIGDGLLPIQIGLPAPGAPLAAVFSARGGSGGYLGFVVVQHRAGVLRVTLEGHGLFSGDIRFVPEGVLESAGDTSRLYRWVATEWQAEDLPSEYLPPLPPDTVIIPYTVDAIRGPMITRSHSIRARVGQHVFLRRMDRGEPSRISYASDVDSYEVTSHGLIKLLRPGIMEIFIESPAYGEKTLVLSVRIGSVP